MSTWVGWAFAVLLAAVLVLVAPVRGLRGTPRSRWLSFSGGIAVGYVFLRLLEELVRAARQLAAENQLLPWMQKHALFLVALAGALLLFGIERAAKRTKERRKERGDEARSASWVFGLHLALMAVYLAFVGYLLFRQEHEGVRPVVIFGAIMAVHFSGLTVSLAEDYRGLYLRGGRWALAAAVLAGAAVGTLHALPALARHLLLGLLAGAIVFNVIKEEIPPDRASRFWAVCLGAAASAALLVVAG